jgi:pimeloyl-ACP methyl ester carboxylesterase
MHWLLRVLAALVCVRGGLGVLFHFVQRRFLYFPVTEEPSEAIRGARRVGLEPWLDLDGRLLGWRAPHPSGQAAARLLVLHCNAGSAANRVYSRDVFQAPGLPLALDVYLLEYPGYGPRAGAPSERAILATACDALDALTQTAGSPLFLLGQSLESAVAALAAANRRKSVAGLVLVTPLLNVPAVARRHFPFLPSAGTYVLIENVGNLVCPALFDLGEQAKVAVLSVTGGTDKPAKYAHMFRAASLMSVNKIDLTPYVDFDTNACIGFAREVNPHIEVIQLSATRGDGLDAWYGWLQRQRSNRPVEERS